MVEPVGFYLPHVNEIGPVRIEFDAVEEDGILRKGKRRGLVMNFLQQSFPVPGVRFQVLRKRNMEAETLIIVIWNF
jgi:hypothetical protein